MARPVRFVKLHGKTMVWSREITICLTQIPCNKLIFSINLFNCLHRIIGKLGNKTIQQLVQIQAPLLSPDVTNGILRPLSFRAQALTWLLLSVKITSTEGYFCWNFVFFLALFVEGTNIWHHAHVPGKAHMWEWNKDWFANMHVQVTECPCAAGKQLHPRTRASGN